MYLWLRDSIRFFLVNLFLYSVLLEMLVLEAVVEDAYHIELPLFSVFIGGVFSFLYMMVWLNMSKLYYKKLHTMMQMFLRSLVSELPFLILTAIAWLIYAAVAFSLSARTTLLTALFLFTAYMVLFPLIMVITQEHAETVGRLEH